MGTMEVACKELNSDEQQNRYRDGAESCPIDGGPSRSFVGSKKCR